MLRSWSGKAALKEAKCNTYQTCKFSVHNIEPSLTGQSDWEIADELKVGGSLPVLAVVTVWRHSARCLNGTPLSHTVVFLCWNVTAEGGQQCPVTAHFITWTLRIIPPLCTFSACCDVCVSFWCSKASLVSLCREGIHWEAIDWMDNAECLDLIEKVPV